MVEDSGLTEHGGGPEDYQPPELHPIPKQYRLTEGEVSSVIDAVREERGVEKSIKGGKFVNIDGITFSESGSNEAMVIRPRHDARGMSDRLTAEGRYDVNNNVIYFGDKGRLHVGLDTEENRQAVVDAGFKRHELWVPFSGRERPDDVDKFQEMLGAGMLQ